MSVWCVHRALQGALCRFTLCGQYKARGLYGSIDVSMEHFPEDQQLQVTIHSCKGLRAMDSNGFSDPYVKLYLTPSPKRSERFKTVIVRKALNPEYHQMFTFHGVSSEALDKKCLVLAVIDHDDIGKDDPLGGISIPLYEVVPGIRVHLRKLLNDPSKVPKEVIEEKERGQILLRFCYLSHQKVLKVGIEKATILPSTGSRCANPYVTCHLESGTSSMKLKTKTVLQSLLPVFSEELEFPLQTAYLNFSTLTITVWDHKKITKDISLGQVSLRAKNFWDKVKSASLLTYEWYALKELKSGTNV